MHKTSYFSKLKEKWSVSSNGALVVIFIVFSITGSSALKLARPVLDFVGLERSAFEDHWYTLLFYWTLRILIIFPIYQVLLVAIGGLFGQFKFFWNFEKKMLKRMGLGFLFK